MTWTTQPRSEIAGLAAIVAGAGQNVLLIHGVGLQAEAWNSQITALAPTYHVVAVDMPGHGQSPVPAQPMTLAGYTDAIAQTLDAPAVVIGHSMGAMIALDMAMRHPSRVRGVAALNAIFQRAPEAASAVRARADSLDGTTVANPSAPLERWFGTAPSPEREACESWLTATSPAGYKMAYQVFATSDGPDAEALTKLTCPALFLTGSEEPNSTPEMSRKMAALAPQGRAQIIDDAAHMMPMTHADEVNAELLRFAKEVLS